MTVNELVDLLATHIAAGRGNRDVVVSMAQVGDVAGDRAYAVLSRHEWTVAGVVDDGGMVTVDLRVAS